MLQAQSDQIFDYPNVIWLSNIIQPGKLNSCLLTAMSKSNDNIQGWHILYRTRCAFSLIFDVFVLLSDQDDHRPGHKRTAMEEIV